LGGGPREILTRAVYCDSVPTALIALGAVLIVFTFLLAFTIFGELSAVVGVACVATGAVLLGKRSSGGGQRRPGQP
jgi:hypothetical protein